MTPAERKRFIWTMVAIVFFFANLIAGAILVFRMGGSSGAAGANGGVPAATSASQP